MLSRRNAHSTALPGVDELAARYGFKRVERVHVHLRDGARVATVVGITHRYPRSIRVPLSVASRLVAAGAPTTVVHAEPPRATRPA